MIDSTWSLQQSESFTVGPSDVEMTQITDPISETIGREKVERSGPTQTSFLIIRSLRAGILLIIFQKHLLSRII